MDSKFKKLQQHWYQKLKDDGFVDIEYSSRHMEHRVRFDNSPRRKMHEQTRDYYLRAFQVPQEELIKEHGEKGNFIWSLHAIGSSAAEISKKTGTSTIRISKLIKAVQEKYKLRRVKK